MYERKMTLALVDKHNGSPMIYLWNYMKDRLMASINLKF
jgi:WD40 repeat protein